MIIHKTFTAIGLAIIFLSGYILFSMKREVETLDFELTEIYKQISKEKGSINLLKTEYVYLTSPARISSLAKKYLNLSSTLPDQMISDPIKSDTNSVSVAIHDKDLTNGNLGEHKSPITTHATKSIKWRYKRMGDKYLHNATLNKKQ